MKGMLKKIWRFTYRLFFICAGLFLVLACWFYFAVRIEIPVPLSKEVLKLERSRVSENFYTINRNWIKKSETGLWEMYVEGDGFERGVIEGKLTRELAEKQEQAFVDQIRKLVPSEWMLNYLKYFIAWFNRKLDDFVAEEYQLEIYGESLYASDRFDFIAPKYHRMLNYHAAHDIGHALQDKRMAVGCTSFAAWGRKTGDSGLLIGRNFDFYAGDAFAENKLIYFVKPAKGYKFMMVSWAGLIGAVSGMNEKGLTVTINAAKSEIPASAATPISLVAREILQYAKNIEQALEIARKRKVFVSESLLIGSKEDGRAVSIEKTPSRTELYESEDSGYLICSNHYRGKAFKDDAINIANIKNSSSFYRLGRMDQLINAYPTLNANTAAAILRNRKGMDDKNIGLGNEKALNQLIAHHAVIFKPSELLVWVSANPYQMGKFVCYDLNKIFAEAPGLNSAGELYEKELSIAADSFLFTEEYKQFLYYRTRKEQIKNWKDQVTSLSESDLEKFVKSNPEYFETYFILGNYFYMRKDLKQALKFYEQALGKEIPTLEEKQEIQDRIKKIQEP